MATPESTIAAFKSRARLYIGLILLGVVCFSIWSIVAERTAVLTAGERQAEGYARALAEHSESAFAESDRMLRDVLHDFDRDGGIDRLNHRTQFDILKRQTGDAPQIGSVFLVDKSGMMYLNSLEFPFRQINVADREYYRHYLNTPGADLTIGKPVMSRLVSRWRFNLMRPLNKPGEPFNGLVSVAFEVEYFKKFFSAASLGARGRVLLIRNDGAPLVFEPYVPNAYQYNFRDTPLFRDKLPKASAGTFRITHSNGDKDPRIISYQRLNRFPVIAVIALHQADLLAPWQRKAVIQSTLTLALCLVIVVLTRIMFRHLDRLQAAQTVMGEQQEALRIKAAQIDAAIDAILQIDDDGRLVQFNQALCRMTGYSHEELIGIRLHQIEPPEYAERIIPNIQRLKEVGQAVFESAYLTKAGVVLPVEVHASITEVDGRPCVLSMVRDISQRKDSELREQARSHILEAMATGVSLQGLMELIVRFVEQENPASVCSILLANEAGSNLVHGAAPSLPEFYNQAVDGLKIAQGMGSCGTAAHKRQRVVVEDIDGHPYWKGFKPAQQAGLRSCWSEPIISSEGELLGTFAIYHRVPSAPSDPQIHLIESAAHLASIAIGHFRAEERRARLEAQLHHVQKIDAIGQLAGGIAHDFNNLLTPIIIYADMIQHALPAGDPLSKKTQGIVVAAQKARDLTQQLLSFGRKQMLTITSVDLNEVITSFHDIMRRTIRENIIIYVQPAAGGITIQADRGQLEQILLNLAVNAQDAISGNGTIIMETGHVLLDNEFVRMHPGVQPGPYALLSFSDNGCGMDDETLAHIFEPFFTTKQVGHGTGLGLATVYGIIKQHNGYVTVQSHVGAGTTFNIYFPASHDVPDAPGDDKPAESAAGTPAAKAATILVVEDNEMVRLMTVELLEEYGYTVHVADRPSVALELAGRFGNDIDLMVTDVVMPEMNGHDLYEQLVSRFAGLKVLYISGYTNEVFVHNGTLEEGINFLQKPFTAERFIERVRQSLV